MSNQALDGRVWDWIVRIGLLAVMSYCTWITSKVESNQEAIQENLIRIERINAARFTPQDALVRERDENAWRARVSERMGKIEMDVQVIRTMLEKPKPKGE